MARWVKRDLSVLTTQVQSVAPKWWRELTPPHSLASTCMHGMCLHNIHTCTHTLNNVNYNFWNSKREELQEGGRRVLTPEGYSAPRPPLWQCRRHVPYVLMLYLWYSSLVLKNVGLGLFLSYVCICVCLCMGLWICGCRGPQSSEEAVGSPAAGVRVGCEQPTWVLGTKRVLCKCSRCSSQLSRGSRTACSPLFSLSV